MKDNLLQKTHLNSGRFNVDFFELCFLAEVCIPPVPIARDDFFRKMIDEYYNLMTKDERSHVLDWIGSKLDKSDEKHLIFLKRYDPENQYRVEISFKDDGENVVKKIDCFLVGERYHVATKTTINPDLIVSVEKITE